jgi:DNA-binding response OmpR family regulator
MNSPSKVLLIDADPALAELLEAWLAAGGCTVEQATPAASRDGFDLIVVDVPFPRQAGLLKDIATAHPRTPILALSSSFFPGIESTGQVARALGVAGVLAKPVSRSALLATVRRLLPFRT